MRTRLHKSIPEGDFHFSDKGPKTVKVFLNQPQTLSFDQAEGMAAVQDFVWVTHKGMLFNAEQCLH